jgi:hypothetical protein
MPGEAELDDSHGDPHARLGEDAGHVLVRDDTLVVVAIDRVDPVTWELAGLEGRAHDIPIARRQARSMQKRDAGDEDRMAAVAARVVDDPAKAADPSEHGCQTIALLVRVGPEHQDLLAMIRFGQHREPYVPRHEPTCR